MLASNAFNIFISSSVKIDKCLVKYSSTKELTEYVFEFVKYTLVAVLI